MPHVYPHVVEATRYARSVVDGHIPVGKYTLLSCKRYLRDLGRKDIEFRPYEAERACRFVELFPHVKGRWARDAKRIALEPWQMYFIVGVFGFYKDGARMVREAYLRVARKNGKSIIAAAIGLYMFVADREFGAEVYSGATSEKQAWEVFSPARLMAARHPDFRRHFGVEVNAKNMNRPEDNSKFEPLIGNPGDGSSPSCAIVDEFHEHRTWALYNTMDSGMAAREQPLILIITTAGVDIGGPCFEKDEDVKRVLNGDVEDDSLFGLIYAPDEDDDWQDPVSMQKANPNYGVSVDPNYLNRQLEKAKRSPNDMATFKTKHLNQWVGAGVTFLNMLRWLECGNAGLDIDALDRDWNVVYGVDLSSRVDLTAVMRLFYKKDAEGNVIYKSKPVFFLPENRVDDDQNGGMYKGWAEGGYINLHPDDEIDYALLREFILADAEKYLPREIGYDPWKSMGLEQELTAQGLTMVRIPQTVSQFTSPMDELEAAHLSGRIEHDDNPVMNWMCSNLMVKINTMNGTKKPDRAVVKNKIDGPVALLMAMNRAMAHMEAEQAVGGLVVA